MSDFGRLVEAEIPRLRRYCPSSGFLRQRKLGNLLLSVSGASDW